MPIFALTRRPAMASSIEAITVEVARADLGVPSLVYRVTDPAGAGLPVQITMTVNPIPSGRSAQRSFLRSSGMAGHCPIRRALSNRRIIRPRKVPGGETIMKSVEGIQATGAHR